MSFWQKLKKQGIKFKLPLFSWPGEKKLGKPTTKGVTKKDVMKEIMKGDKC